MIHETKEFHFGLIEYWPATSTFTYMYSKYPPLGRQYFFGSAKNLYKIILSPPNLNLLITCALKNTKIFENPYCLFRWNLTPSFGSFCGKVTFNYKKIILPWQFVACTCTCISFSLCVSCKPFRCLKYGSCCFYYASGDFIFFLFKWFWSCATNLFPEDGDGFNLTSSSFPIFTARLPSKN